MNGFLSADSCLHRVHRIVCRIEHKAVSERGYDVFLQVGLRTGPSVGIRFDATESVALKLQYDYTTLRRQGVIDEKSCVQLSMCAPSAAAAQVDFKF